MINAGRGHTLVRSTFLNVHSSLVLVFFRNFKNVFILQQKKCFFKDKISIMTESTTLIISIPEFRLTCIYLEPVFLTRSCCGQKKFRKSRRSSCGQKKYPKFHQHFYKRQRNKLEPV